MREDNSPTGSLLQLDCWPKPWCLESKIFHTWRRLDRCQWWRAARCTWRQTHAHTRTNRGSYTFSNKTDGRMHSWHNTHPFVPINRYYTNLLTIFHIAVTMVTKKNQQLHSVLLTLPCTQLNHHPLPFPSLHPPFLQNTTFHYNFFPLFRQTCRDCHIQ